MRAGSMRMAGKPPGKRASNDIQARIANRTSWFKIGLTSCAALSLTAYLLLHPVPFSLQDLRFSDLLALLLSLFAIALSVAFYFKANETANDFYHNSYQF